MKTLKIFITLLMLVAISFAQNEERIGGKILFSKEPISNEMILELLIVSPKMITYML